MSNSQHRCVFVGNIPYDATEEQLIQICEEVGPVVSFRLVLDRDTGKPKGYGFCEFRDEETALSARRNLQGYEINGRQLRVDFAENEKGVDRNREQGRGGPGFTSTYDSQKQGSGIRTIRDPSFHQPVGIAVAAAAASVMAGALGGSQVSVVSGQPTSGTIAGRAVGTDPLTIHLAGMSKHQLFEIISQMKGVIQQNQQQARQTLVTNPLLTKALFQAQIILGLVQPSQLISNLQPLPQKIPIPSMSQPLVLQQHAVPLSQGSQTRLMQLHSVQTSPMQLQPIQTVQQGKMLQSQLSMMQNQIPQNASIHSQLKGFQQSQSQIPISHSSQSVPFQHPMQSLQQSQKGPIQPVWQNVSQLTSSSVSIQPPIQPVQPNQPFHPLIQQSQPSSIQLPPEHMQQPISQLNRPPGPQVHPVESMGFQLPPIQQQTSSHQSAVQQHRGIPQSSMGMQHQPLPPLPSQPPLQQLFQMSNSSAELGASGITQSGFFTSGSMLASSVSMPLGGHQQVRGPAIEGTVTRPISSVTWVQIPQSGTVSAIAGVPHSSPLLVMAGNGSCNSTSNGDTGSPAALAPGGNLSNATPLIQHGIKTYRVSNVVGNNEFSDGPSTSGAVIQSSSQPQQPHQTPFGLEQQKALLQQVMNLTPEQISSLPPEQRQQVIQLQQAFRS